MALRTAGRFSDTQAIPSSLRTTRVSWSAIGREHRDEGWHTRTPCSRCGSTCGRRRTGAPAPELYARRARDGRVGRVARVPQRGRVRAPHVRRRLPARRRSCWPARWRPAPPRSRSWWPSCILPLYDPVRLAEEMVVLDIISEGRVSYVAAIGYRPVEYEMFGVDFHRRGQIAEEKLELLLRGQDRRAVRARRPAHPRHPDAGDPGRADGGRGAAGAPAAARRAGRFGLGFLAQGGGRELEAEYAGGGPGRRSRAGLLLRPAGRPADHRVRRRRRRPGVGRARPVPHARRHGATPRGTRATPTPRASRSSTTAEELRAERRSHRILSVDEASSWCGPACRSALHPLIGGLPPELAWRYLETVTDQVMPALS